MSLNDPQWGNRGSDNGGDKRPNQGPPDLEELWRDFNQRLSALFGNNKGGNNRGNGDGNGNGQRPPSGLGSHFLGGGISLILAVVLMIWLGSGLYMVDAPERGLVLQFGRYLEETGPGLRWRLPYPIQSHEIVNAEAMRAIEIGYIGEVKNEKLDEALMLTDDENIIKIKFAVQYKIKHPRNFIFKNRDTEASVKQVAETAIREVIGKNKMDFILNTGRGQIEVSVRDLMQTILDRYETGISISTVAMQPAQPPAEVQAAFNDVVEADQDKKRQENEGQAYANTVIPGAKGTASRLLQEAEGYKQRLIATAEGDASRFAQIYTEYAKAPEVMRSRMYLETMQQIYANTSKVMVDTKGQGNLLYLPLDKLMQASGAVSASGNVGSSAEMPAQEVSSVPLVPPVPSRNSGQNTVNLGDRSLDRNSKGRP